MNTATPIAEIIALDAHATPPTIMNAVNVSPMMKAITPNRDMIFERVRMIKLSGDL